MPIAHIPGIAPGISQAIVEALQHPLVQRVVLFGSRATGRYARASDIDLAVHGPLAWADHLKLMARIDDLELPYKVDLVAVALCENEALKQAIERDGLPLAQASL